MRRNAVALIGVLGAVLLAPASATAAWRMQTTPTPRGSEESILLDVACEPENISGCTAVGATLESEEVLPLAMRWNGREWSVQSPLIPREGTSALFDSVACRLPTSCIAAGSYVLSGRTVAMAQRWNGSTWSAQTAVNPAGAVVTELTSISCTATTACTAAGYSVDEEFVRSAIAERWDGSSWRLQTVPLPAGSTSSEFESVMCRSSVFCVGVGRYDEREGRTVALAATWNGTEWGLTSIANPTTEHSVLLDVSCIESNTCDAVGGYFETRGVQKTLIEHWNGRAWSQITSPNPVGSQASVLQEVSCTNGDPCVAVGDWIRSGTNVNLAMNWTGREWAIEETPNPEGASFSALFGVSCRVESCLAVGYAESSVDFPQSMTR